MDLKTLLCFYAQYLPYWNCARRVSNSRPLAPEAKSRDHIGFDYSQIRACSSP